GDGAIGIAGFGGGDGDNIDGGSGAGLGGAVFVRSGSLEIINSSFTNNTATGGTGGANDGQGLGGAIFAMQSTTNVNGNNQGMPTTLPTVTTADNVIFSGNTAGDANGNTGLNGLGAGQDNNDIFGTITPNSDLAVFTFEQFAQFQAVDNGQLAASNSPFLNQEIGGLHQYQSAQN
ncbi:MAG: hypothetical protein AAFO87_18135, partial [Cyanobacteria bacterium J06607_6]